MGCDMRALLCVLLVAGCAHADDSENRRHKLPYVADAVGNSLPPPSNGPATVGSPVNLLTPDRYEFYTFDESGELVKRLMTLEEIQAIVAAGEESEGLVTFANENQPTIAFNFSQPPYTKVHSVVTNVQNVLKAQMEAHKNKPQIQPTLDTPDVSDSWSLILPSIFGNTGVDIVPDKTSATFTTPETETIELDRPIDDNSISKEGSYQVLSSSSTNTNEELKEITITEKLPTPSLTTETATTTTTTTTTTPKPSTTTSTTTTTTTAKPISSTKPTTTVTTTKKPPTTTKPTTTVKLTTTKPTTVKLRTSTTTTTTTTTSRPQTSPTTSKPRTTTTTKLTTKLIRTTPKLTTVKPGSTTKKFLTTQKETDGNFTRIQTFTNAASTTDKSTVQYEKISTFIPLSTAAYVTERLTQKTVQTTKAPSSSTTKRSVPSTTKAPSLTTAKPQLFVTTYKPTISSSAYVSLTSKDDLEKFNITTITTQSISPSTTVSSTEYVTIRNEMEKKPMPNEINNIGIKENETEVPLFDISQSISQIASDLGGNYRPIPTTSELLDTTKFSDMNLESKENLEIDIPSDSEKEPEIKKSESDAKDMDNFVKISTLEPHGQNENKMPVKDSNISVESKTTTTEISYSEITTSLPITTTIDPVLSESMDDLLSQIVNQAPHSILNSEKRPSHQNQISTTEPTSTTMKEDKLMKLESTSEKALIKVNELIKAENAKTEMKNLTNDIPQINKDIKEAETKENKPLKPTKNNEKLETNSLLPTKSAEDKQNLVKIESVDKIQEKIESSMPLTTLKPADDLSSKKIETKSNQESKLDTVTKQQIKKSDNDQIKEHIPKATAATTTAVSKMTEPTTTSVNSVKKSDSVSSNVNKIIQVENDKTSNTKENDKVLTELPLPKVDDFKKKIQKVNIDDKELLNERNSSWKLISTVSPPKTNEIPKDKLKSDSQENPGDKDIVLDFSKENQGLEVTTKDLSEDIAQFTELCNELAFRYWHTVTGSIEKRRSFVMSPYSITSMLAMMFMGARGATSGEMNEILKLDDMVTFNPHFTLKNISDSIETTPSSGVIVSAFVRELFSDRSKGKVLTFYKERAQHFYNGHVEEINFKLISDIIRRRTNLLVKRYTWGKIVEYMKANTITMNPPLAAFAANIFETDCSGSSVEGRDGEMYFVVSPNVRQRRLVPVPAVVYRSGFLAGYDPVLDATAAALGNTNSIISTLFLMPGQQGNVVHAEDLEELEKRFLDSNPTTPAWNRLLRTLLPRIGLELQIPRFSHKSLFNVSTTLQKMGLKDLFDPEHADLGGLNGPSKDLYLSDMIQSTTFVTCGEGVVGEQHHIEEYPENLSGAQRRRTSRWVTGWDEPRDYQRAFHDPHDVGEAMHLPLHLRPRQARLPARNAQPARLKFDRPFLYFIRHNPSGMILYVGRFNPRLLP